MIEKGIPFTDGRSRNSGVCKYPWAEMEVGDSFLVTHTSRAAMSSAGRHQAKKLGWKFRASTVEDGVRVWRVA